MIAPPDRSAATAADALGAAAYPLAVHVLRARGGLVFAPPRRQTIESALGRVMRRMGVLDAAQFAAALAEPGPVFDEVMSLVTVGETYFFREPSQFAFLRDHVLRECCERRERSPRPVRMWSAACATGEEAYSLAITALEAHVPSVVIGTDVARARLAAARRGRYREWSMRGVPRDVIDRYFTRVDNEYSIAADLRRDLRFLYLNLTSDRYPAAFGDAGAFD
ncbi:MAG TPA: CheR family methyltransferase, partial [Gemmatimonadaceae bacterium]|nr:CheR family methyltransferase [Gemmatimonadaceae bacterium]